MRRGYEEDVITGRDERGDVGLRKKAAGLASAIALIALLEAARKGEYRASFHGFRVQALRQGPTPDTNVVVDVNLYVRLGKNLVEHSLVAMGIPQSPGAALLARPGAARTDAGPMEPIL